MAMKVIRTLSICLTFWCVLYISHGLDYLHLGVSAHQSQAIFLGLLLPLTFLLYPAKKGTAGVKWYDWLLIVISVVPNGYIVFFHDLWQFHGGTNPTTLEIVFCIAVTVALLEGLRRVLGIILSIILLFFILHPLLSNYMPGILFGRGYSLARVSTQIYLPPAGIYSMPLNIAATIVIAFLLFGQLLLASGGGKTLMDATLSMVGRLRGGAAKAAVVASGLFGTFSGAVGANVATTGTFTIPMMKNTGYEADFAAGVEASASNGGMLMPPVMGAVAFIMAEMLAIPYFEICIVAFTPAILYYVCMFMQVHFEACRKGLHGLPPSDVPSFKNTIKVGWLHFIPVLILIYFMFALKYSPELSAFWATISILLVTAFSKKTRLNLQKIMNAMEASGKVVVQVGLACAMAGIIMSSVSLTGVAFLLSGEIVRIAGGSLFLLLFLAAIASFVLGMGMTSIPCYIFVALMVAPALIQMGIAPIAAHLFVFWLALGSFITPPVCIAAYVASAIAETPPMRAGLRATMVGIGIYVIPFVFIYNPALLLNGSPVEILLAVIASLIGIIALAAGLEGFLFKRTAWWQRALLLIGGIMMFVPIWWIRLFALVIIVMPLIWQRYSILQKGL